VVSEKVKPARFAERELSQAMRDQLGGTDGAAAVIWTWQGSEIVLHLDTVRVAVTPGQLLVRLDCETDQTGRVAQQIRLALPHPGEQPNFVATTDLVPDGDERVSPRWAGPLQDAVWAAVLQLADQASPVSTSPAGVAAGKRALIVYPGEVASGRSDRAIEVRS
jgi:hypothetical protein